MRRALAVAALLAGACQSLVEVDLGAGIGATCSVDDECQGSSCLDGICSRRCGDNAGCPGGTECSVGICELPLNVGYVYPFPLADDDLAKSFDLGRIGVEAELGNVSSTAIENKPLAQDATDAALDLIAQGHTVIVASSSTQAAAFAALTQQAPDANIITFDSFVANEDVTSLQPRIYQAYYLAGFAAARTSTTKRLGMIGSVITPSIVARINAFALGARRALEGQPMQATIEVKWVGEWHDTTAPVNGERKEFRFTRELIQNGADVIAHTLDSNIPLYALPKLAEEMVFGKVVAANLPAACEGDLAASCVGSAYFNWTPMFRASFHAIQREEGGGFLRMGLATTEAASAVGFRVGDGAVAGVESELEPIRAKLAGESGVGSVFAGPITSAICSGQTNQTPCVAQGDTLDEDGLARMCWFIDGVGLVERPQGIDMPAVVPQACVAALPAQN